MHPFQWQRRPTRRTAAKPRSSFRERQKAAVALLYTYGHEDVARRYELAPSKRTTVHYASELKGSTR